MTTESYVEIDLEAIIEQERRRVAAMSNATSAQARNQTVHDGRRADAESPNDRPCLIWPDQRHLLPPRCHHCGAGRANFETRPPYGMIKRGETTCLVCSRVEVTWRALVPKPAPLSPEESLAPKRGRPPGPSTEAYRAPTPYCSDCRVRVARVGSAYCKVCAPAHRRPVDTMPDRLLALLKDGRTVPRDDLIDALDITPNHLKSVLRALRLRGQDVQFTGDGYVLKGDGR